METIVEEEKTKKENLGIREWIEEDKKEIDNMVDPYYKEKKIP